MPSSSREPRARPEGFRRTPSSCPRCAGPHPYSSSTCLSVTGRRSRVSRCGCPGYGLTRHLRDVRSFEKLTSAGMTFLDVDVIRILDETLPARFGGCPANTSSSRRSGRDGRPRVRLLVHPGVGPVNPAIVREAFLVALGSASKANRSMAGTWREAGLVEVERRPP